MTCINDLNNISWDFETINQLDNNLTDVEYPIMNNKVIPMNYKNRLFTIEAVIPKSYQLELRNYFLGEFNEDSNTRQNGVIYYYNKVYRTVFNGLLTNPNFEEDLQKKVLGMDNNRYENGKYINNKISTKSCISQLYHIPNRVAYSIYKQAKTEYTKWKAMRKSLIEIIEQKISILNSDIIILTDRINELKPFIVDNTYQEGSECFKEYKKKKELRYHKINKLKKKEKLLNTLNEEQETGIFKYCIGVRNCLKSSLL